MMTLVGLFTLNVSLANEAAVPSENAVISGLILELESKIKAQPELLDQYLAVVEGMFQQHESDLKAAVQAQSEEQIRNITQNRELIRQMSNRLYQLKEQQQQKKAELGGRIYTFRSQLFMPRLSMSWGKDEYFTFPSRDAYVQLNWTHNIS